MVSQANTTRGGLHIRSSNRSMVSPWNPTRYCSLSLSMRLLLLLALVVVVAVTAATPRKEIDWDALEKAWEADDAPQELRSHGDDQYDRLSSMPQPQAQAVGPQMVFVTLQTREPLAELATRWKEMLWSGGVDVTVYEIEATKVLIGLQKGLFMRELRLFLQQQHEVVVYDWNSKTYTRDDPIEDDSALSNKRSNKTKKKTKKKKAKSKSSKKPSTTQSKPTHDDGF